MKTVFSVALVTLMATCALAYPVVTQFELAVARSCPPSNPTVSAMDPNAIAAAKDGGWYIAGTANAPGACPDTYFDGYVVRFDKDAGRVWATRIALPDRTDTPLDVAELSDGSAAVCGVSTASDASSGERLNLTHLDANGSLLWSKKFRPLTGPSGSPAGAVTELSNGDIAAVSLNVPSAGDLRGLLVVTQQNGSTVTIRDYTLNGTISKGTFADVAKTSTGIAMLGITDDVARRLLLIQSSNDGTSPTGTLYSVRTVINGSTITLSALYPGIAVRADGRLTIVSYVSSDLPTSFRGIVCMELNTDGSVYTSKLFGTTTMTDYASRDISGSLSIACDGHTVVSGVATHDAGGSDIGIAWIDPDAGAIRIKEFPLTATQNNTMAAALKQPQSFAVAGFDTASNPDQSTFVALTTRATDAVEDTCDTQAEFPVPLVASSVEVTTVTVTSTTYTDEDTYLLTAPPLTVLEPHVFCERTFPCPADLDNGSGNGILDGGVDINDLLFFLTEFEGGSACVDVDNGTGTGTPDGGVDINDLLFFLAHFESGC